MAPGQAVTGLAEVWGVGYERLPTLTHWPLRDLTTNGILTTLVIYLLLTYRGLIRSSDTNPNLVTMGVAHRAAMKTISTTSTSKDHLPTNPGTSHNPVVILEIVGWTETHLLLRVAGRTWVLWAWVVPLIRTAGTITTLSPQVRCAKASIEAQAGWEWAIPPIAGQV